MQWASLVWKVTHNHCCRTPKMTRHNHHQALSYTRAVLVLYVFCAFTAFQLVLSSFSAKNFRIVPDYSLLGNVTETHEFADYLTCALVCMKRTSRCLSFNFGGNSSKNLFTCELSNSLKAWDPQNFQRRPGFDFYEAVMDPSVIHPCLSSPCQNGGTCGEYKGKYTCKCPLEIGVLPYIDNKCNVQMDLVTTSDPNTGVFQGLVGGHYKLNFYEAERLCKILEATMASYDQLYRAWENGFQHCSYGWLADATRRYPMKKAVQGCGSAIGIIGSSTPVTNLQSARANVWCYKST